MCTYAAYVRSCSDMAIWDLASQLDNARQVNLKWKPRSRPAFLSWHVQSLIAFSKTSFTYFGFFPEKPEIAVALTMAIVDAPKVTHCRYTSDPSPTLSHHCSQSVLLCFCNVIPAQCVFCWHALGICKSDAYSLAVMLQWTSMVVDRLSWVSLDHILAAAFDGPCCT